MDPVSPAVPHVIVVAERSIHDLLATSGAHWQVQERQLAVGGMWDALSGGRLDPHSRILVFSDSLLPGQAETELRQTAKAVAAMSAAGAHVFLVNWLPDSLPHFQELVSEAAQGQNVDPDTLAYTVLPGGESGRVILDMMRGALDGEVVFPDAYPESADQRLVKEGADVEFPSRALGEPDGTARLGRPKLPPIRTDLQAPDAAEVSGLPAAASRELLSRPRLDGQMTITVTSAKGGSGKSTVSVLLAGAIAQASKEAGHPLSVCLVDLDTRDGQVASLIGQFMPTALNIRVQPVWDEDRIRRNLVHADELGIDTLLAPIRPRTADTVGPDFYRAILRSLQRMFDVVVMDTSVQYLDPLIADVALPEADEILFVTTLASTAVQGMARALREITTPLEESGLGIPREKIGIVVNQSVANVGMERDQILAAGLGVPVIGVVPLATKDVLTATNFNRMHTLLKHPLIGPTYYELAKACLPHQPLAAWVPAAGQEPVLASSPSEAAAAAPHSDGGAAEVDQRRRGLFRR